jgi:hypothetical protein
MSQIGCILRPGLDPALGAAVLEIFGQHGLHHHDDRHTRRAIELVWEASLVYDAQLDAPAERANESFGLSSAQLQLVQEMCEDARFCVTAGIETCAACDDGLCGAHASALARAESYRAVAA